MPRVPVRPIARQVPRGSVGVAFLDRDMTQRSAIDSPSRSEVNSGSSRATSVLSDAYRSYQARKPQKSSNKSWMPMVSTPGLPRSGPDDGEPRRLTVGVRCPKRTQV